MKKICMVLLTISILMVFMVNCSKITPGTEEGVQKIEDKINKDDSKKDEKGKEDKKEKK